MIDRMPRWLSLPLGIAMLLLGAGLVLRPFQSLSLVIVLVVVAMAVAGIATLAGAPRSRWLAGVAWLVAAVVVAAWPGPTVAVVAWVVGVTLVVTGIADAWTGLRGEPDNRPATTLSGLASIGFGLVALAWPDVTLFVVGIVLGVRLVLAGIGAVIAALRGRPEVDAQPARRGTLVAIVSIALAAALVFVSVRLNATAEPDAFYDRPASVPAAPGNLVRSEPFERGVPNGARGWRILYTTERADGAPALSSGLVVVPEDASQPAPLVSWAHGTTGRDVTCAPSLLPEPFESGALFVLDEVIANGWALVATDYIGLGADAPHGYLVGGDAGRAVLDAARAARQLADVRLSDETVVWGHSQGGGSALWAGVLAGTYAPDAGVIGVAALSAASDLPGFVSNLQDMPGGSIFASYVLRGYADTYPDVRVADYVRASPALLVREMADRCLADRGIIVSVLESLVAGDTIWSREPGTGPLANRLAENVPTGPIDVPLLMAQGTADPIIPPDSQAAFVAARCAADAGDLEYRTYEGYSHVDIVQAGSPLIADLLGWTRDRWAGAPPTTSC